jgi:hypothetical protein
MAVRQPRSLLAIAPQWLLQLGASVSGEEGEMTDEGLDLADELAIDHRVAELADGGSGKLVIQRILARGGRRGEGGSAIRSYS